MLKGVIFAAGRGDRMRPVTDHLPKALLPIMNRPVIDLLLEQYRAARVGTIGINVHHHAEQITAHLRTHPAAARIHILTEASLTGNGGALCAFGTGLARQVLISNCDVVHDIDLNEVRRAHGTGAALATLVLVDRPGSNCVRVEHDRVVSIARGDLTHHLTYSGVAMVERRLLEYAPRCAGPLTVTDLLRKAIAAQEPIQALVHGGMWYDVGGLTGYWHCHQALMADGAGVCHNVIARDAHVETSHLSGFVVIGAGCSIGADVHLHDALVLPGTTITHGRLSRCIAVADAVVPIPAEEH